MIVTRSFSRSILAALILGALIVFTSTPAQAQIQHELIRRMAIFPVKVAKSESTANPEAEKAVSAAAEEAWWQIRDEFTRSRRFLVASKQFLVKSDAFQPRGELEPADAIILGRLLDAHALVTLQLDERELKMSVFDGTSGLVLWRKNLKLHPSLTVGDQLPSVARRLADDFIASIPYQGFTTIDSLIGTAVYEEGESRLVQVDFGVPMAGQGTGPGAVPSGIQIGDVAQWIRVSGSNNVAPLFQGGGKITVFAEGKVIRIEQGIATIELLRATSLNEIKEYTLVRVPREAERLQNEFSLKEAVRTTLTAELVAPELSPMEQLKKERRPLVTTVSFISSLAALLLLAF